VRLYFQVFEVLLRANSALQKENSRGNGN